MRRTKIVATLGPATDDPQVVEGLIQAGVDVVRLNYSHGSHEEQANRARMVRELAEKHGRVVGVLADMQGPKIRTERFKDGKVELQESRVGVQALFGRTAKSLDDQAAVVSLGVFLVAKCLANGLADYELVHDRQYNRRHSNTPRLPRQKRATQQGEFSVRTQVFIDKTLWYRQLPPPVEYPSSTN